MAGPEVAYFSAAVTVTRTNKQHQAWWRHVWLGSLCPDRVSDEIGAHRKCTIWWGRLLKRAGVINEGIPYAAHGCKAGGLPRVSQGPVSNGGICFYTQIERVCWFVCSVTFFTFLPPFSTTVFYTVPSHWRIHSVLAFFMWIIFWIRMRFSYVISWSVSIFMFFYFLISLPAWEKGGPSRMLSALFLRKEDNCPTHISFFQTGWKVA